MINESEMKDLVAKLPECYQPIFGFPQLDEAVSRQCDDRLVVIRDALESLVQHYGRPLRVLDLGCAQGFFSLSVADLCESVLGIDYLAANIDVCNAARDAADLQHVRFETGEITEVISKLEVGQFDVVFGLSVFHHLCHLQGWPAIADRLKKLADAVDVQLLELADAREPLYWAPSLPADAVDLIRKIGFIYPLGVFPTHLGDVERTLYFCSDRIWRLQSSVSAFDHWTQQSHEFAGNVHQGTRRYFFAQGLVAKTIRFSGVLAQHSHQEYANEEAFFLKLAPRLAGAFPSPKLISIGSTQEFGHVVTERLPGLPLAEAIVKGIDFDESEVLRQVLGQLVQLEAHSLYHRDVRVWNVLLDDAGNARLMDFAAIGEHPGDDVWPYDVFASFLIFVGEVTSKAVPRVHLFRRPMLSSAWLKEPYRSWFDAIWAQSHRQWSFAGFLKLFEAVQSGSRTPAGITQIHADNWALWRAVSERLLSEASDAYHLQREAIAARATREEFWNNEREYQARLAAVDTVCKNLQKALEESESQNVHLLRRNAELEQHSAGLEQHSAEVSSRLAEMEHRAVDAERARAAADVDLIEVQRRLVESQQKISDAEQTLLKWNETVGREEQEHALIKDSLARTSVDLADRSNELIAMRQSTSWRLMAPLRGVGMLLRRVAGFFR
jgi:O-antigen chain-terminating methyltransferase